MHRGATLAVRHASGSTRLSRTSRMSRWISMVSRCSNPARRVAGLTVGGEERDRSAAAVNREHGESGNAAPVHRRWMHRRKRHCRRIGRCAPMPLSYLDGNNARTMPHNRRTRDVTLDRLRSALLFNVGAT